MDLRMEALAEASLGDLLANHNTMRRQDLRGGNVIAVYMPMILKKKSNSASILMAP